MESRNLHFLLHVITTVILLLTRATSAIPSSTLQSASDILWTSGHLSMSLTLKLISNTMLPHSPSLTIFSPNDAAFAMYGQPSLSLLQYHFSPLSFPLRALSLLPRLSPIPTLLPNHSLTVSPRSDAVYINNLKLSEPLFDDGHLVIYSIEKFLDPEYDSGNGKCCVASERSWFEEAVKALREAEYSEMAGYLDGQILGYVKDWEGKMTVFAPTDEEEGSSRMMMRYVVNCRMTRQELDEGVEMKSYVEGYGMKVGRSGDIVLVNDVPVAYPDLYVGDSIVVHGLRGAFHDDDEF